MSRVLCVIPARYGAERLPGKPLLPILGRPMIQWVMEIAQQAKGIDKVLVATDDERIAEAVAGFGGEAVMTDPALPSGSDRVWQAAQRHPDGKNSEILINLQGDEPLMAPETLSAVVELLERDPSGDVATACVPITDAETFQTPNAVKVVRGEGHRSLYFSRSPIPSDARFTEAERNAPGRVYGYKHLGLYAFRRPVLEAFVGMPPSPLEKAERLEQLRILEAGYKILCGTVQHDASGVDVAADIAYAERILRERGRS
ncbi:MAG: 3-deoxy-manno-octulosonate cytidylyltransferase [Sumerlaeia bacterium]